MEDLRTVKLTPTLDRDDRAALVRLAGYGVVLVLVVLCLLVLAVALGIAAGLALRLFLWAS